MNSGWFGDILLLYHKTHLFITNQPKRILLSFLSFDGFNALLPVSRTHHPYIRLIRLIQSKNEKTLTLFLHDSFHQDWFKDSWGARYGFLAVADRYQKYGCDFYHACYYHFSYLIGEDYEVAKRIMQESGN